MSVNGIGSASQAYDAKSAAMTKSQQNQDTDETKKKDAEEAAAVYDKNTSAAKENKIYKRDSATIQRLLAESEKRAQSLRELVQKMLLKQGETLSDATDIYALLREGKVQVGPEVKAQAQKDIAEDGYWGVNQTSDRILSFAKALTGGDVSKANEMIEAVKKGFEQATKAWGGDLPEISSRTLDETIKKLEAWRDGTSDSNEMSSAASNTFKNQAAKAIIATD